jgi:Fic family protein
MKTRYLEVDDRTEELNEILASGKGRAQEFQGKLDLSVIYHENALEGIVFSSAEMLLALDPTAVAVEASMIPVFSEVRNHKAAIDFVRAEAGAKKTNITLTLVKKLYEILGAGIEGREKATYRKDMPLHRTYFHEIDQPTKIAASLEKLVDFTTTAEFREQHPINQAASVQWSFMQAFPFPENNGKVARLLSHLVLIRQGYLPAVIHSIDRQRYYECLRMPMTGLRQLLLEAMENSLDNAFNFFGRQPKSHRRQASNE